MNKWPPCRALLCLGNSQYPCVWCVGSCACRREHSHRSYQAKTPVLDDFSADWRKVCSVRGHSVWVCGCVGVCAMHEHSRQGNVHTPSCLLSRGKSDIPAGSHLHPPPPPLPHTPPLLLPFLFPAPPLFLTPSLSSWAIFPYRFTIAIMFGLHTLISWRWQAKLLCLGLAWSRSTVTHMENKRSVGN